MLVLAGELVFSIRQQSQTLNESVHIFSGNQYWRHRDFGANPEHPPLVKLVAALPLLALDLKESAVVGGQTKYEHYMASIPFLYHNNTDAGVMLFRTRMAASVFTYLLAILVLLCGYEMLGAGPALLGLALLVFEPNLLAHGALVTTDVGEACFLFASVYAFYRYVEKPTVGRLAMCGVAVALALAAKHSGVVVAPILVLLALGEWRRPTKARGPVKRGQRSEVIARKTFPLAAALLVIFAIGCAGLWACYTFRYAARPEGAALSPPLEEYARALHGGGFESNVVLALARARALPESYLWGLTDVLVGAEGRVTFLLGKVYTTGQWFYFPLVFLMKATLGLLLLLAAFPFVARRIAARRELLFLTIPPVVFLGIAMLSGLNLGVRHILPVFPFLILLAAAAAGSLARRSRVAAYVVGALLLAHAASSLHAYPNYLAYSNEVVGGPSKSYRVMSDSNVDWGQGLTQAARYLAEHHVSQHDASQHDVLQHDVSQHDVADCWFAYSVPAVDPGLYRVPCRPLQSGDGYRLGLLAPPYPAVVAGTILIGANEAAGQIWGPGELNPYQPFFERPPDAVIAGSILVFHGSFDISLAAAMNHAGRAWQFLAQKRFDDALGEARTAVELAPHSAEMQVTLCEVLRQMNRAEEGRQACQAALSIARNVYPDYQALRIPAMRAIAAGLASARAR
jgi:4-amino-4-deoxy-L-arabinose transferase-like glycosyltransferase